jgi:hypothetical protein
MLETILVSVHEGTQVCKIAREAPKRSTEEPFFSYNSSEWAKFC